MMPETTDGYTEQIEITIYGASDDLFEIDGPGINEEFGCWDRRCVVGLYAPDGTSLIVWGEFTRDGWQIGVETNRVDGGPWPRWGMRWAERPDREGDPALIITAPLGTTALEVAR